MMFFSNTVDADDLESARAAVRVRIGENLQTLRNMRKLSPEDVAAVVGGMTAETIRNYEKGKGGISFENAWRLADFYGIPIGAIGGRISYEPVVFGSFDPDECMVGR